MEKNLKRTCETTYVLENLAFGACSCTSGTTKDSRLGSGMVPKPQKWLARVEPKEQLHTERVIYQAPKPTDICDSSCVNMVGPLQDASRAAHRSGMTCVGGFSLNGSW